MTDNQTLQKCFSSLEEQLYKIEKHISINTMRNKQYIIDDIIDGGIFTANLEDAQQYIYLYKSKIDDLLLKIPSLLENFVIAEKQIPTENPFTFIITSAEDLKQQLHDDILSELSFYNNEITGILNIVLEKMNFLGTDRFANAGYKVAFNFTNEEIGSFFNILYEAKIISSQKSDGSELSKKELADFISKNFTSKTSIQISTKGLVNSLSRHSISAESKVSKALTKMQKFVST